MQFGVSQLPWSVSGFPPGSPFLSWSFLQLLGFPLGSLFGDLAPPFPSIPIFASSSSSSTICFRERTLSWEEATFSFPGGVPSFCFLPFPVLLCPLLWRSWGQGQGVVAAGVSVVISSLFFPLFVKESGQSLKTYPLSHTDCSASANAYSHWLQDLFLCSWYRFYLGIMPPNVPAHHICSRV